ncbi:MAG: hypothetical protein AAF673_01340 [Pseudomonadota bacterium]
MNNYKIYAPLVLAMGMLMFLLNYCTKIATCAFVFTLLMLTVNTISKTFGFKRALQTISAYVGINILFLSDYNYTFDGQVFEYLVPTSLLAVLLASLVMIKTTSALEGKIGSLKTTFLALIFAAVTDGVAMSIYFANYFSASIIDPIFLKEISFKCLYAFVILSAIKVVSYALGKYELQDFRFKLRS